jgi:hypothetical protein
LVLLSRLLQRKFGKNPSQGDPGKRILGFCYRYHEVQTLKRGILKLSFTSCIQKHPQEKRNTKDAEGGKKTSKHTRTLKPILAGGSPDAPPNLD